MSRWVTFDCYGTLIDWESGIAGVFQRLWPDVSATDLLGSYHRLEPQVQTEPDRTYRQVMAETMRRLAAEEHLQLPPEEEGALADSLPSWRAFPEVPAALRELRRRRWSLAILSNTDPDLLAASVRQIGVAIDLTVTVAESGSYKPAPGHWLRFRELSGASPRRHVHVAASLFHDIAPVAPLGLPAVWINRTRASSSGVPLAAELPDLFALPDVLDRMVLA